MDNAVKKVSVNRKDGYLIISMLRVMDHYAGQYAMYWLAIYLYRLMNISLAKID